MDTSIRLSHSSNSFSRATSDSNSPQRPLFPQPDIHSSLMEPSLACLSSLGGGDNQSTDDTDDAKANLSSKSMASEANLAEALALIQDLTKQILINNKAAANKDEALASKDEEIAHKDKEIARRDELIANLSSKLMALEANLAEALASNQDLSKQILTKDEENVRRDKLFAFLLNMVSTEPTERPTEPTEATDPTVDPQATPTSPVNPVMDKLIDLLNSMPKLGEGLGDNPDPDALLKKITEELKEAQKMREKLNEPKTNSKNSSLPGSKDLTKPGKTTEDDKRPEGEKRKRGAQPGHKAHHREFFPEEEADRVVVSPEQPVHMKCRRCNKAELAPSPQHDQRRFQYDLDENNLVTKTVFRASAWIISKKTGPKWPTFLR